VVFVIAFILMHSWWFIILSPSPQPLSRLRARG
jgi:hypothetical protein